VLVLVAFLLVDILTHVVGFTYLLKFIKQMFYKQLNVYVKIADIAKDNIIMEPIVQTYKMNEPCTFYGKRIRILL
jgi:hypothetical protein